MTKQEAIDFIEKLDDETGVFVVSINKDDVEQNLSGDFQREFKNMSSEDKKLFLSSIATQMNQLLEEGENWGVGNLMKEAVDNETVNEVLNYFDENDVEFL